MSDLFSIILQLAILLGVLAVLSVSIFIYLKLCRIMATLQDFEAALSRIDAATTDIAEDIRKLKDDLQNQGLPADVEDEIVARLSGIADKLEQIGSSVENPVPPETGEGNG